MRLGRALLALTRWVAGVCPCDHCEQRRRIREGLRQYRGRVPRKVQRQMHRDGWRETR